MGVGWREQTAQRQPCPCGHLPAGALSPHYRLMKRYIAGGRHNHKLRQRGLSMLTAHKTDQVVIPLAQDYAFNLVTSIYYQLGVVKRMDPQLMRVTGNVFITGGIGSNVPVTVTVERVDANHSRLRFACSAEEGIYYRDRAGQGIARILNSVSAILASVNVSDTDFQGRSSSTSPV